jgi:hypothetical protein
MGKGVEVCLDGVPVCVKTKGRHDTSLMEIFKRLKENRMRISKDNIQFAQRMVKLLGVTVDGKGRIPAEMKRN